MDDLINVVKRDQQVQKKIKDILDKYNEISKKSQLKIGYDTLI